VSASTDGTVRIWFAFEAWVEEACRRAGRNLSQDEWNRYVGTGSYVRSCARYPSGPGADPGAPVAAYSPVTDAYPPP
jgi:hypothetical protein